MNKYRLPQGVGDSLPESTYRRADLENKLTKLFFQSGYDLVDTSVLENAETYRGEVGALDDSRLFHIKDSDGSLIVLRADMTLPLSRIAATKLPEEYPLRLSYVSPCFTFSTPKKNREREFRQAGVELFGIASAEADAEVVSLAIESLLAAGIRDFLIDIGQVGIVKGILSGFSEEKQLQIVSFIDKKNLLTEDLGLGKDIVDVLNSVLSLYGGEEVLEDAQSLLTRYPESLCSLNNLKEVFSILKQRGYAQYLSIDLGLVNSYSYYSGVVFKAMTASFGDSLIGGGRYDRLIENYGKQVPATGFAVGIRAVLTALQRQDCVFSFPATDLVVGGIGKGKAASAKCADEARKNGLRASNGFSETKEELLRYAKRVGALRAVFFGENGEGEELI